MDPKTRDDTIPQAGQEPGPPFDIDRARGDITEWDLAVYGDLVSTELTPEQKARVAEPDRNFPRQRSVLAVHWHPEWIPFDLIDRRLTAMYPSRQQELIIPTQHNQLLVWGDYAGVEADCYSSGFRRKVQLLFHFKADRVAGADVLKSMLSHTFRYRTGQLFEFMDTILNPDLADRFEEAVEDTGANDELVDLVRFYTARLKKLIEDREARTPPEMIKNKLLSEYVDVQRARHPDRMINRALMLIKATKRIVKRHFSLEYFFRASEFIEEVRALGGGVVIPHPEQFWPILLADYDVDGWEVWNPQSRQYTEFLISALAGQNRRRTRGSGPLLIFMGDDTHLSVKVRDPVGQDRAKLEREVGLQPAWDEVAVRKSLSLAGASRAQLIEDSRGGLGLGGLIPGA
jgi:hypothetical protein